MPYGYYYFDPTYVLVLIGALLSIWASSEYSLHFASMPGSEACHVRYDRGTGCRADPEE